MHQQLLPQQPQEQPRDLALFIPITKVDVQQRLVYGTLTEEVPDKSGEILDYDSAKPQFQRWSQEISAGSGGKSVGNVRAMHGAVAAGKLIDIQFDDSARRIEGVAKIIDEDEWQKVLEGVYTGFSLGGRYLRRWPDPANPELTRYTPEPCEVSIVDNPCVPTATFTLVKLDGKTEQKRFSRALSALAPDGEAMARMKKIGARNSKADLERLQKLHDMAHAMEKCAGLMKQTACDLGAAPAMEDSSRDEDDDALPQHDDSAAPEAASEAAPGSAKSMAAGRRLIQEEMNALLKDMMGEIETLRARVAELEAEPMPMKGVARALPPGRGRSGGQRIGRTVRFAGVAKGAEGFGGAGFSDGSGMQDEDDGFALLPPIERARLLMKQTLADPRPGHPSSARHMD